MAYVELVHPSKKKVSFEFGHAMRILKLQRDKGYKKESCWTMDKEINKETKDDTGQRSSAKNSKREKESESN